MKKSELKSLIQEVLQEFMTPGNEDLQGHHDVEEIKGQLEEDLVGLYADARQRGLTRDDIVETTNYALENVR